MLGILQSVDCDAYPVADDATSKLTSVFLKTVGEGMYPRRRLRVFPLGGNSRPVPSPTSASRPTRTRRYDLSASVRGGATRERRESSYLTATPLALMTSRCSPENCLVGKGGKLEPHTGPSKVVFIKPRALQKMRDGPRYAQYCRNNVVRLSPWIVDVSDDLRDTEGLQVGLSEDDQRGVAILGLPSRIAFLREST